MIYSQNIKDLNHIKSILDRFREEVLVYESLYEMLPEEYSEIVNFQLCEIDEFIIGPQKCTDSNIANSNIRMMGYWEYISGECSFGDMLEMMKEYEGDI